MKLNDKVIEACAAWVRENGLKDFGGACIEDYCKAMGFDKTSHYRWIKDTNSTYTTEIEKAKDYWLSNREHNIVKSLYRAAIGYDYTKRKTEYANTPEGVPIIKKQIAEEVHVPPSVGAAVFLLTNINPQRWQNKIQSRVDANVQGKVETDMSYNLADIPDDKLFELADLMQDAELRREIERKYGKDDKE